MIRALLCALGFHKRPPGVNPRFSIFWCCEACPARVRGELAAARPLYVIPTQVGLRARAPRVNSSLE